MSTGLPALPELWCEWSQNPGAWGSPGLSWSRHETPQVLHIINAISIVSLTSLQTKAMRSYGSNGSKIISLGDAMSSNGCAWAMALGPVRHHEASLNKGHPWSWLVVVTAVGHGLWPMAMAMAMIGLVVSFSCMTQLGGASTS